MSKTTNRAEAFSTVRSALEVGGAENVLGDEKLKTDVRRLGYVIKPAPFTEGSFAVVLSPRVPDGLEKPFIVAYEAEQVPENGI